MVYSSRFMLALAALPLLSIAARADDWPQWMGVQRDDVWRETGIIENFPKEGLKLLWRKAVSGGYSGPSVANGRVFVTDYLTKGDVTKEVFDRTDFKGQERIQCFSAEKGELLWEQKYDCNYTVSYPCGPRASPTVHDGKVYVLGTEGNLNCYDAAKGAPIWSKDFKKDYKANTPLWGFCGSPLVEGNMVICIVGGENACVVAFNKDDGKEIWKALNAEEPGYSSPTLIEAGGKRQLLIWHGTSLNSLNPVNGEKYWSVLLSPDYKMSIMSPRMAGEYLFAAGIGDRAVLLKLAADKPEATEVWRGKKNNAVYPVNMTPFIDNGTIYGVNQPGELTAVDLKTAERRWATADPVTGKGSKPAPSATAFIVKNGDRFFIFNEKGELVIAKLSPDKYEEIGRTKLIDPTGRAFGREVVWSHPAFANKCVYVRNDKEIVCYSLAK
ncbi:MAG: PQQ-like beta-propeller repeat protein [Planctomycetes bacterium]|nr:PQQ-like beta-propeller repeat protein [Planctomycetota bacterium]